ncbi:ParB/RepB/Spo0J family partition protein [Cupriavidus necator]|uniref:ParB/RepB/Spo0J family partition protein n=1 Tax=Cupriavidus necator TaxID=106590 RepID=UPI003ECDD892
MSIKDRLLAKSGDIGVARPASEEPQSRERDSAPKTGPGQMLAFRQQMLEHTKQVESLKSELEKFDGAQPVRKLDPKLVHRSRWANRHEDSYSDGAFQELREAIKSTQGNVVPIKVRPREDGEYELVFGNRRHHACLVDNLPVLAQIDEQLTDRDLFMQMEHENRERKNPSAWEQGRSYQMALDVGLWPSQNAMASDVGVSQAHVSRSIAAFALPSSLVEAFDSPNDIQFPWVKDLTGLSKLDPRVLAERLRQAKEVTERTPKKVFAALMDDGPREAEAPKAARKNTGLVSVSVSGKDTKVVCKKTVLTEEQQQKLAELVDDFIQSQLGVKPTA